MAARPHFHLGEVPVRVEPFFFVVIALLGLGWEDPVLIGTWIALAFISVLLHEMGHAWAFRRYGHRPSVLLHGFGGLTSASGALSPGRSIVVSLAGPGAALVLLGVPAWFALVGGVGDGSETARLVLVQAVWINVGWSLLNLLPVLPLDGGNVTASVLELFTPRNGRRIAAGISIAVAGALAALALVYGLLIAALIGVFFVAMNVKALRPDRDEGLREHAGAAVAGLLAGDVREAEGHARRASAAARAPGDQLWGRELIAWARLFAGDPAPAADLVRAGRARPDVRPSVPLESAVAIMDGRVDEGLGTFAWSLVNGDRPEAQVLGASFVARSGLAGAVAEELLALDGGSLAVVSLRDLFERLGYREAAVAVERHLRGEPR